MFASPFFTSGRASILPSIASKEELHTANSLTQLTQWTTVMIGSFLGGTSVAGFGYKIAFVFNAFSFLFSALCISRLHGPRGFRSDRSALTESSVVRPWHEYTEGLRYMRATPLILGDRTGGRRLGHRRRRGADSVQLVRRSRCSSADPRGSASSGDARASGWCAGRSSRTTSASAFVSRRTSA